MYKNLIKKTKQQRLPEKLGAVDRFNKIKKNNECKLRSVEFKRNLLLRVLSRPEEKKFTGLEFIRRVFQLILFVYRISIKAQTIKGIIWSCYKKRNMLVSIENDLQKTGIRQDNFIYFCYWRLNRYPEKLYRIIGWICFSAFMEMRKYETADVEFWNTVYQFLEKEDRGRKLKRLVEIRGFVKNNDVVYDELKNI